MLLRPTTIARRVACCIEVQCTSPARGHRLRGDGGPRLQLVAGKIFGFEMEMATGKSIHVVT